MVIRGMVYYFYTNIITNINHPPVIAIDSWYLYTIPRKIGGANDIATYPHDTIWLFEHSHGIDGPLKIDDFPIYFPSKKPPFIDNFHIFSQQKKTISIHGSRLLAQGQRLPDRKGLLCTSEPEEVRPPWGETPTGAN